jgi:hypothetical protein
MKKTVLILLSVTFFLTPIYSCYFPSHSLASMYKKINQPLYRISLGVTSMILLQFFNKKTIPGLRIPGYIKNISNTIEQKERERKVAKIIDLFKECDFIPSAIATFQKYGHGDAFAGKKNNLFLLYNNLRNNKENLVEKIKIFYEKKKAIGKLNFKPYARGEIAPFKADFFTEDENAENCVIDEYLAGLLEKIDREEQLQNNFFSKLLFHNFTEKIKYLLILGELQLILYCLPFIYKELNKTVED